MISAPLLLATAALEGALTFFSPCGFPMFPAYVAFYLQRRTPTDQSQGAPDGDRARGSGPTPGPSPNALPDTRPGTSRGTSRGTSPTNPPPRMGLPERQRPTYRAALGGALAAGLGSGAVLLLVGLLVAGTASVADLAVHFELIGGLIAIALGIATLVGRGFSIRAPARAPRRAGWQGLAGFGALYGLVAAGCSAPVLLSIVATGASAGLLVPTFAAYAAGLVVFMVLLTVLVAYAKAGVVDRFRRLVRVSGPVSGAVLIVVGAYLVYYWWSAIHPGAIG